MQYSFCSFVGIIIFLVFLGSGDVRSEEKKNADSAKQLTQGKAELKALQKKIEEKKKRINETQTRERKAVSELNKIEKDLFLKQQSLKQYEISLRNQNKNIEQQNSEIETLQVQLKDQTDTVASYMRALYALSRMPLMEALFSTDSFYGLIQRFTYLRRIIVFYVRSIDNYSTKLNLMQNRQQQLRDDEKKLTEITEKTRATQEEILRHKKDKTELLTSITSEKELHLKTLTELEQASTQLQGLVDDLQKALARDMPPGASLVNKGFFPSKNHLSFPVEGSIATYFGKQEDDVFFTISHSKGIEIVAAVGTPIKAVFEGHVIYADWFKGYGNIIIIDHGDGYFTLSGHASEVFKKVGDQIREGETIGLVGDTGSLKGSNLYFEIRHHGVPLDPLDWLRRK